MSGTNQLNLERHRCRGVANRGSERAGFAVNAIGLGCTPHHSRVHGAHDTVYLLDPHHGDSRLPLAMGEELDFTSR